MHMLQFQEVFLKKNYTLTQQSDVLNLPLKNCVSPTTFDSDGPKCTFSTSLLSRNENQYKSSPFWLGIR